MPSSSATRRSRRSARPCRSSWSRSPVATFLLPDRDGHARTRKAGGYPRQDPREILEIRVEEGDWSPKASCSRPRRCRQEVASRSPGAPAQARTRSERCARSMAINWPATRIFTTPSRTMNRRGAAQGGPAAAQLHAHPQPFAGQVTADRRSRQTVSPARVSSRSSIRSRCSPHPPAEREAARIHPASSLDQPDTEVHREAPGE